MKKILEYIKSLKTHPLIIRATDMYETLPPERKKMVLFGGGALIILVVFLLFNSGFSYLDTLQFETKMKQDKLLKLALDYDELLSENRSQLASIENKLKAAKQWVPAQYLKDLFMKNAALAESSIQQMEDSPKRFVGATQEIETQVQLANVTLKQVIDILSALETPERPLSVQNLNIQTSPIQNNLLNVSFNIHSFRQK
ncbi:MAG: hypothetical protein HYW47_02080 [Deltaproteobacteria bacterium]|nr:hypothetical protein [Deltaproteobacteria bacterium]